MQIKVWFKKIGKLIKEIRRWIKALRNPCKKCLVNSTCQRRMFCKPFNDYEYLKSTLELIGTVLIVIFVGGFVISTFFLGLFKWFEILF